MGVAVLDGIGHADEAGDRAADDGVHHGHAIAPEAVGLDGHRAGIDIEHGQQIWRCRGRRGRPSNAADDTLAGFGPEVGDLGQGQFAFRGGIDDGGGERMFRAALQACHRAPQFPFSEKPGCARTARTFGLPSVSVPVLSMMRVSTLLEALERLGIFDQHADLGAAADANHDRHGRREAKRAGTGDNEHG